MHCVVARHSRTTLVQLCRIASLFPSASRVPAQLYHRKFISDQATSHNRNHGRRKKELALLCVRWAALFSPDSTQTPPMYTTQDLCMVHSQPLSRSQHRCIVLNPKTKIHNPDIETAWSTDPRTAEPATHGPVKKGIQAMPPRRAIGRKESGRGKSGYTLRSTAGVVLRRRSRHRADVAIL
jgi:hypothetical protein